MTDIRRRTRFAQSMTALFVAICLSACANWPQGITPTAEIDEGAAQALAGYLAERAASDTLQTSGEVYQPWVALLPFDDVSGFHGGVFDLPRDIPGLLSRRLAARGVCRVVPPAAVEAIVAGRGSKWAEANLEWIGDSLRVDHLITGLLLDYNFERLTVGDPLLGGYKSYVGTAEIEAHLRGGSGFGLSGTTHSRKETQNRGLGLDLLGKPREGDRQFVELGSMEFGGEEFSATAIGEATLLAMEVIVTKLTYLLQPQQLYGLDGDPTVLSVFGSEIFIDVGNDNGVKKGYRFTIETGSGDEPAIVEVEDIISAGVSRVVALRGGESIVAGQTLRLIGVDDADGE